MHPIARSENFPITILDSTSDLQNIFPLKSLYYIYAIL